MVFDIFLALYKIIYNFQLKLVEINRTRTFQGFKKLRNRGERGGKRDNNRVVRGMEHREKNGDFQVTNISKKREKEIQIQKVSDEISKQNNWI